MDFAIRALDETRLEKSVGLWCSLVSIPPLGERRQGLNSRIGGGLRSES
jgi:hypothetical protein